MKVYDLGDLRLVDTGGGLPPARLLNGIATIAARLHSAFDEEPWMVPDFSKESCVLAALAARDFLRKVGCKAEVAPVYLSVVVRKLDGKQGHSLGVGDHKAIGQNGGTWDERLKWSGHLVVLSGGWLIDPTLYQCQRPAWPALPGMFAVPVEPDEPLFAGLMIAGPPLTKGVEVAWRGQPANTGWRVGADCAKSRRENTIAKLVEYFASSRVEA